MQPHIIGDHPLAKGDDGKLKSRIATAFPYGNTIVTLPGIHATQRLAYVDALARQRAEHGLPPLTREEETVEWHNSVDLIVEGDTILIRPDPNDMPLCFRADEMLQELAPKHHIKFLLVRNEKIHDAVKRRGECWRINSLSKTPDEMNHTIAASRIAIHGDELYYYSQTTGTRFLTYEAFSQLGSLDDATLRRHLSEIRVHSAALNRHGNKEIAFFIAGDRLTKADFAAYDFDTIDAETLRVVYETLEQVFRDAVPVEFQKDDIGNVEWRNRMYAALIGEDDKTVSEESLLGLASEFFMQIEWLPGGRIEDGELIFDSVFELAEETRDPELQRLCDYKCRGFIFNFVREYGDLEYVNIGCIVGSLSRRAVGPGRRGVYIAQIKQRGVAGEIIKIIRMQKWAIREHLDDGQKLLDAIIQSEEYTDYILDRRLGCRQLGMNVPTRSTAKRISEQYHGRRPDVENIMIWSPYFERDYIRGMATDKIPPQKLADPNFALRFARLLGQAAAPNMIVGRCQTQGNVIFDDGDEVVIENEAGQPIEIIVADQTGTFFDYRTDLEHFAAEYAEPVNCRLPLLTNPREFAALYVDAFVTRFTKIQSEYRKRKRGFDTLFKHRPRDEAGMLERLRLTVPQNIGNLIQSHITGLDQ